MVLGLLLFVVALVHSVRRERAVEALGFSGPSAEEIVVDEFDRCIAVTSFFTERDRFRSALDASDLAAASSRLPHLVTAWEGLPKYVPAFRDPSRGSFAADMTAHLGDLGRMSDVGRMREAERAFSERYREKLSSLAGGASSACVRRR